MILTANSCCDGEDSMHHKLACALCIQEAAEIVLCIVNMFSCQEGNMGRCCIHGNMLAIDLLLDG